MKKTLWTLLALLLVVAFSCKEDEPDPTLDVDQTALTVLSEGGSNVLKITSNASWTVKSDKSWAVLSTGNDNGNKDVTVVTEKNSELAVRTATITVLCANLPAKTVTLSQFGEGKAILIKSVSYTGDSLLANGGTFKVIVSSNVTVKSNITAENNWLTENAPQGVAKTIIDKEFLFKVAANYDAGRTAKLRFFEEGNAALADSITVKQKAGAGRTLEIKNSTLSNGEIAAIATTFTVDLTTNLPVIAIVPDATWMSVIKMNDSTFRFSVPENMEYANIIGDIIFKDSLSSLSIKYPVIQTGQSGSRRTDSLALIALYDATDGSNWPIKTGTKVSPWNPMENPITKWYGVTVSSTGRVTEISLPNINIQGRVPGAFYNLPMLTSLSLNQMANLSIILTDSMANLRSIEKLYLAELGKFTGTIPPAIARLTALKSIDIHMNVNLTGSIPKEIGRLSNLTALKIYQNKLSGTIPDEIYDLTNLATLQLDKQVVDAQNPGLTGTISPKIGKLTKLTYLNLSMNKLSGALPKELFEIGTVPTGIYLQYNNFTGSLPNVKNDVFPSSSSDFSGNRLSGDVLANTKGSKYYNSWKIAPQQAGYVLTTVEGNTSCTLTTPILQLAAASNTQINLYWGDNDTTRTKINYIVESDQSTGVWVVLDTLPGTAGYYEDKTVPAAAAGVPGTRVNYRVYYTYDGGPSAYSPSVGIRALGMGY